MVRVRVWRDEAVIGADLRAPRAERVFRSVLVDCPKCGFGESYQNVTFMESEKSKIAW